MKNYSLRNVLKDMSFYSSGHKKKLLIYFIATLAVSLIAMIPPYLYGQIVGNFTKSEFDNIYEMIAITAVCLIIVTSLGNLISYKTKILAEYIRNKSRVLALNHLFHLDYEFHENKGQGGYLERISTGSKAVRQILKITFTATFKRLAELFFAAIILLIFDPIVGFIAIFILFIFFYSIQKSARKYQKMNQLLQEEEEENYSNLFEFTSKIKTVRFLNITNKLLTSLEASYIKVIHSSRGLRKFERITSATHSLMLDLSEVLVLAYVAYMTINGNMGVDIAVAIYAYYTKVTSKASNIWQDFESIMDQTAGLQRISTIFEIDKLIPEGKEEFPKNWSEIEFKKINFSYLENIKIIKDISLTIKKDEKLAIVGASGSGKSTLTKLLMKLYTLDSGEINIENINVLDIKNDSLLNAIKVVPQQNELLSGSIKENLELVLDKTMEDKDYEQALELSDAMKFISKYESGINQKIGKDGKQLSGGEIQRICIARALITNPQILVLDEATASLDTVTEKNIYKSLSKLKDTTMIAITHRISSGPFFDRIVVMDNGEIVGVGHHNELVEKNEVYKRLWEASKH